MYPLYSTIMGLHSISSGPQHAMTPRGRPFNWTKGMDVAGVWPTLPSEPSSRRHQPAKALEIFCQGSSAEHG